MRAWLGMETQSEGATSHSAMQTHRWPHGLTNTIGMASKHHGGQRGGRPCLPLVSGESDLNKCQMSMSILKERRGALGTSLSLNLRETSVQLCRLPVSPDFLISIEL